MKKLINYLNYVMNFYAGFYKCNYRANSGSSDHAFRYELIRLSGCN